MRTSQIFFSLVSLLIGFFLFCIGFYLYLVPFVPLFLDNLRSLLLKEAETFSRMGLILMVFSVSLISLYGFFSRRKYFLIQMGGKVSVHEKIIKELTFRTFKELFPELQIHCDVLIRRKRKIEILVDIPYIPDNEEEVFEKIENTLNSSLKQCGIEREFILNVRFN